MAVTNYERLSVAFALALGCGVSACFGAEEDIDFATQIRPIFNKHCVACHGGVKRASGVSYIVRERALAPAKSGKAPIKPGEPDGSELIRRVTTTDEEERMPPSDHGPRLSVSDVELLREWIRQGAPWKEHWAYVRPQPQPLPKVSNPAWCFQPLDYFVLARLDGEGLKPSPPADRAAWLRRVSLDLIGLPPAPEEVREFVRDSSAQAFEKVVDRLLASPHFGERWAALWLDLARYADTMGYEKDPGRNVWPYRDWLIRAFNADMPFDQFTVRQLAGDLLPDATMDDRIATVFHRNTQSNTEGGTDDEEFRLAAVIDRVNTTWQVWRATTFGCVQCHAHPYDPIDHDEYYRFLAFFDTTQDWDLNEEFPLLRVPLDEADRGKAAQIDGRIATLRRRLSETGDRLAANPAQWRALKPDKAESTGSAKLDVRETNGVPELIVTGTITSKSRYTLEGAVPPEATRLTALRVEALPMDEAAARSSAELGFVLSKLKAVVVDPNRPPSDGPGGSGPEKPASPVPQQSTSPPPQDSSASKPDAASAKQPAGTNAPALEPGEITFAAVFDDDPTSFYRAEHSLTDDPKGWAAYTRMSTPRRAIFVPEKPVELPPGARLRLTLAQDMIGGDAFPLAIRRARFAISESDEWPRAVQSPEVTAQRRELAGLQKKLGDIKGVNVPVMAEQDARRRRVTRQFVRGNWLDKGAVVEPGVPKLFPSLPPNAPADRLAMAHWLVSTNDPLTGRVAVNRFWEQLFGLGLVETLEDFGSSGARPSHPELLDFLALRFQNELGWSLKRFLRELTLSATYRQDAKVTPALLDQDPGNRLLARGPRVRLSAEMVRDQALAVTGLLSRQMHGAPVMPPQPRGVWRTVYNDAKWETSKGDDKYRRALYTYWKRTSGYPSFLMFDAPSREVCSARRIRTNTPLQALVTLNDPVFVECAVALAGRMAAEAGPAPEKQIARGYELATCRPPAPGALRDLLALHRAATEEFADQPDLAAKLSENPQQAALAVVANAILNLDAVLTK
jgi:hypothetical protein